jgi:hypothetical protein
MRFRPFCIIKKTQDARHRTQGDDPQYDRIWSLHYNEIFRKYIDLINLRIWI